jgi:transcriptional regulator with XRE-family HTH domain
VALVQTFGGQYLCPVTKTAERILLGLKVKMLRKEAGLSFVELAERAGLSSSYLNEIEKGKKQPRPDKLRRLAQALGVPLTRLSHPDPGPHLAPVAALLRSNFLQEIPLELFGFDLSRIADMLAQAPTRVNAFVSSLLELAQHHALGASHFYLSTMRAYQELHNNYFPEWEKEARLCREAYGLQGYPLKAESLKKVLKEEWDIDVVEGGLAAYPELRHLRSVYLPAKGSLLLQPDLRKDQLLFQLCKEIGFHYMRLEPRPLASTILDVSGFQEVLHNFRAGYFAVALLMDEQVFMAKLAAAFQGAVFDHRLMVSWMRDFEVGPNVLLQRFNVITGHWGLDQVFYHKLVWQEGMWVMDKELHLHRLDRRYAGRPDEHYCRRWLSSRLIQSLRQAPDQGTLTGMARVWYPGDDRAWLCLGIAHTAGSGRIEGQMIGVALQDEALERIRCHSDPGIPEYHTGLTCERCPVEGCEERAAPPVRLEERKRRQHMRETLRRLT